MPNGLIIVEEQVSRQRIDPDIFYLNDEIMLRVGGIYKCQ